jgi:hypothetical protein
VDCQKNHPSLETFLGIPLYKGEIPVIYITGYSEDEMQEKFGGIALSLNHTLKGRFKKHKGLI